MIRKHYPQIPRRVSGYNLDSLLPEQGFNVARALVGKSEGDVVDVTAPGGIKSYEIVAVRYE